MKSKTTIRASKFMTVLFGALALLGIIMCMCGHADWAHTALVNLGYCLLWYVITRLLISNDKLNHVLHASLHAMCEVVETLAHVLDKNKEEFNRSCANCRFRNGDKCSNEDVHLILPCDEHALCNLWEAREEHAQQDKPDAPEETPNS